MVYLISLGVFILLLTVLKLTLKSGVLYEAIVFWAVRIFGYALFLGTIIYRILC